MKAGDVLDCLRNRFVAPEWAFVEELSLIPGFIRGRRADAVAINCWTSGKWGLAFLGLEIKVSRSDFLHELKHPKKRVETYPDVDGIFFATPKGLVSKAEVPADCGLIECWTKDVAGQTVYSTRIQKYPTGFKSPMDHASWNMSANLHQVPTLSRAVAVAVIRAFDPDRINQDHYTDNRRMAHELREAKSDLKWRKKSHDDDRAELEAYRAGTRLDCPNCKRPSAGCKGCEFKGWIKKETP